MLGLFLFALFRHFLLLGKDYIVWYIENGYMRLLVRLRGIVRGNERRYLYA